MPDHAGHDCAQDDKKMPSQGAGHDGNRLGITTP